MTSPSCFHAYSLSSFNYFHPNGRILWLPFRWNIIFIVVNAINIALIVKEKYQADHVSFQEKKLYEEIFLCTGMTKVQFYQLLKAGTWESFMPGDKITMEGFANNNVMLLVSGRANVTVKGEQVYRLKDGNFIGEMGLHAGIHIMHPPTSSATVTVEKKSVCFKWRRGRLIDLLETHTDLAHSFQSAISNDMLRKLHKPIAAPGGRQSVPAKIDGVNIQLDWYKRILSELLRDGKISEHDINIVQRFRKIHHIKYAQHLETLKELGWKEKQYLQGSGPSLSIKNLPLDDELEKQNHAPPIKDDSDNGPSMLRRILRFRF